MRELALDAFQKTRIVACVRTDDATVAREAALAAYRGGVKVLEVTLTTPGALALIEELSRFEGCVPGAGTALEVEDARRVAEAGGHFALSPIVDEEVVRASKDQGLLSVPGAATPTEIVRGWRAGADLVKVFPIGQLGGPGYIRAVRGPLPNIPLVPTNGVSLDQLGAYFEAGVVALGFGEQIFPKAALRARDWDAVEAAALKLVDAVAAAQAAIKA